MGTQKTSTGKFRVNISVQVASYYGYKYIHVHVLLLIVADMLPYHRFNFSDNLKYMYMNYVDDFINAVHAD